MAIFGSKKEKEQIAQEWLAIEQAKAQLTEREEFVRKSEQVRDNGFADATSKFNSEIAQKRKQKESELSEYENSERKRIGNLLMDEHDNKVDVLSQEFATKKQEYDDLLDSQKKLFKEQIQETEKAIKLLRSNAEKDLENELARQKGEYETFFEAQKQELQRYKEEQEKQCDEYIASKKQWIDAEVEKAKNQIAEDYKSFREKLANEESDFNAEIKTKRETQEAEFEQRRKDFESKLTADRKEFDNKLDNRQLDFDIKVENKEKELNQRKADLDKMKSELDLQTRKTERDAEANANNESRLNDEIDSRTAERKKQYEQETQRLKDENTQLLASIETANRTITIFEELKAKLGGEDPAAVLKQLKDCELQIQSLRQELTDRPGKEIEERFNEFKEQSERLQEQNSKLETEVEAMKETVAETDSIRRENQKLAGDNELLTGTKGNLEAHINELQTELNRLQASYKNDSEREDRIKDIKAPYIANPKKTRTYEPTEQEWLQNIENKIKEAEFEIPQRILYAFHTALKTAEMSPITVLAGVSGTGKSALPQLYSDFGGFNYLSLAVQPNWDSQESMLGFFNSIDNKFDAQPVLRLLAQSQEPKTDDYPGLKDNMNLILLDEMNLAHIELYFAEFLSKLEERRGKDNNHIPKLAVKLGSGMTPFDLELGRNVLWCGTMNQDETTKSLSDKVLDRGIIINFPRPTVLKSKRELSKTTAKIGTADLLNKKTWMNWLQWKSTLNEEETKRYKGFIEEMNGYLSKAGRALGHRVWQSIEYYMSNYPLINSNREETLRIAFEDQLVQKVMPKLRGIETRGKTKTECLDKIRKQIADANYNLVDDFDFACEFGYGQFIWNSANYLKEETKKSTENKEETANE